MPRRRSPLYPRLALLAALALGLTTVASPAAALPPLQTFTAGLPADAQPDLAAVAPDGDVWFSQSTPGTPLGRITPDGTIVEQAMPQVAAALSSPLRDLAVGPDGDAWLLTARAVLGVAPDGSLADDLALWWTPATGSSS